LIVVDTSGLLAVLDDSERLHSAALTALEREKGPRLLSPFVLAEMDFLIAERSRKAEIALLGEVGRGVYQLEPFGNDDLRVATQLVERYEDLGIGLADASIVVLAARWGTDRVLTLDERHFRVVRPLRGNAFTILPADA